MTQLQVRIMAYDSLDKVCWMVHVWDYDKAREGEESDCLDLSGAMQGQGSANPTKWLRELLEELREAL